MKSIFQSRVFWVAVIQGIIGVVVVIETSVPGVGWIAIVKTVLDIGLRLTTTDPVRLG